MLTFVRPVSGWPFLKSTGGRGRSFQAGDFLTEASAESGLPEPCVI